MTNIQKIKQAREEMDAAFEVAFSRTSRVSRNLRVRMIDMEVLQNSVDKLMALQADCLRQATEVADENFERAQKLSEQVQENVRHIEWLAERSSEEFKAAIDALEIIAPMHDHEKPTGELSMNMYEASCIARRALALAKGEAV